MGVLCVICRLQFLQLQYVATDCNATILGGNRGCDQRGQGRDEKAVVVAVVC